MCPVFQLVYISRAAIDLTYSDLQTILDSSRKNNENLDLTGVLIYRDGFFMQLLEGSEENVLKILSRIVADRRNNHLQVIVESKSNMRIFDSWRMAYLDGDIELLECREPWKS